MQKNYICKEGKIYLVDCQPDTNVQCECYDIVNKRCTSCSNCIQAKDIWENLYKCRELELNSLWTRAVFLWGMIALVFGGYGAFLINDKLIAPNTLNGKIVGLLLSIIIYSLGLLAVFMAKGSKFWYEVYEKKIEFIENNCLGKCIPYALRNNEVSKAYDGCNLFSGTRFSPSKINILLGVLISLTGFILGLTHSLYLFCNLSPAEIYEKILHNHVQYSCILFYIGGCAIICSIFFFCSKGKTKK